ncbi:hypothetical protein QCA50_019829 [Cerrena zonata]|uniref:Uncharacterized protein n=1 Tax=Cerrena zonata TaxID=2478898 RepID=A0AAW0F8K3_9APHY
MSQVKTERRLDNPRDVFTKKPGDKFAFRARVHHIHPLMPRSSSLYSSTRASSQETIMPCPRIWFVRWRVLTASLSYLLRGSKDQLKLVKSTTIHGVEIKIEKLLVVAAPISHFPF